MDVDLDHPGDDEHMDYEEEQFEDDTMMVEEGEGVYDEEPMEAEPTPLISPFTIPTPSAVLVNPFAATFGGVPGSATSVVVDLPEIEMVPVDEVGVVEEGHLLIVPGVAEEGPSVGTFVEDETRQDEELGSVIAHLEGGGESYLVEEIHHTQDEGEENEEEVEEEVDMPITNTAAVPTTSLASAQVHEVNGRALERTAEGEHDGHEEDDEGEEYYDEDEEHDNEDEEDEEDSPLTIDTIPSIILNLPHSGARVLFAPIPEDEHDTKLSVWLKDRKEELGGSNMSVVLGSIREELEKEGLGGKGAELIVVEKQMNLKMGEVSPLIHVRPLCADILQDDSNLQNITLLQFLQLHHDCELPEPVQLYIQFEADRFITRFNAIQREVHSQAEKRRESMAFSVLEEDGEEEAEAENEVQGEHEADEEYEEEFPEYEGQNIVAEREMQRPQDPVRSESVTKDIEGETDVTKAEQETEMETRPKQERSGRKRGADDEISIESEGTDRVRRRRQDDHEQDREVRGNQDEDSKLAGMSWDNQANL
jgi:hypothetical protein